MLPIPVTKTSSIRVNIPIVPGCAWLPGCSVSWHWKQLDWRITFVAPVYAGDELCIYRTEGQLAAYVRAINVFVIKEL